MKKKVLMGCLPIAFPVIVVVFLLLMFAATSTGSDGGGSEVEAGQFIFPKSGDIVISSPYGPRIHPVDGTADFHLGIDIVGGFGEEVLASAAGTIVVSQFHSSYGNYIIIEHEDGYRTLYAHMSRLISGVGDTVTQGQTIGLVGSTGTSTGPHIHFEIWENGERVDPITYFEAGSYTYQ